MLVKLLYKDDGLHTCTIRNLSCLIFNLNTRLLPHFFPSLVPLETRLDLCGRLLDLGVIKVNVNNLFLLNRIDINGLDRRTERDFCHDT